MSDNFARLIFCNNCSCPLHERGLQHFLHMLKYKQGRKLRLLRSHGNHSHVGPANLLLCVYETTNRQELAEGSFCNAGTRTHLLGYLIHEWKMKKIIYYRRSIYETHPLQWGGLFKLLCTLFLLCFALLLHKKFCCTCFSHSLLPLLLFV